MRFARALARSLTSLVTCAMCSLKSRVVLMWNPSILYDLLGGEVFDVGSVKKLNGEDLVL